ncbi:MAG: GxxExxY protein [Verrucomicrobia bacterium]|nr:MAG: GxxExxY protein [Verrucomicrobiota bacterium]
MTVDRQHDQLSERVIGLAIEVHRSLGPGLLESIYEECLCLEIKRTHLNFRRQVVLPVSYKGVRLNCGYRLDLVVENRIVVEVKAIEKLMPVHEAQLLTYMRLGRIPVGLLLNFNSATLKDGIRRLQLAPQSHCLTASL